MIIVSETRPFFLKSREGGWRGVKIIAKRKEVVASSSELKKQSTIFAGSSGLALQPPDMIRLALLVAIADVSLLVPAGAKILTTCCVHASRKEGATFMMLNQD